MICVPLTFVMVNAKVCFCCYPWILFHFCHCCMLSLRGKVMEIILNFHPFLNNLFLRPRNNLHQLVFP